MCASVGGIGPELRQDKPAFGDFVLKSVVGRRVMLVNPISDHCDGSPACVKSRAVSGRVDAQRKTRDHGDAEPDELPGNRRSHREAALAGFTRADHGDCQVVATEISTREQHGRRLVDPEKPARILSVQDGHESQPRPRPLGDVGGRLLDEVRFAGWIDQGGRPRADPQVGRAAHGDDLRHDLGPAHLLRPSAKQRDQRGLLTTVSHHDASVGENVLRWCSHTTQT